ncbi:helix-turn-helix domain-containing protein [Arcobacter vandammei]|uniref:winged helix-turn-helix domain-containing protein n=1 Tax=Arcobacter vandammei TaxID=2782243 RepID=UPI0018DF8F3D
MGEVIFKNQKEIYLTKSEKNLLFLLLSNRGEKVNYNQIEEFIYNGVYTSSNAIRTLMKRLRQKLPENLIKNCIDEGYFIEK